MSQMHRVTAELPADSAVSSQPLVVMERSVLAMIVAMLAIGLHRAFIANVNWDEFYFLSMVHLYQNGTLTAPLQTIHVHLFGWLPLVSGDEIHQIFAARVFVWVLSGASCWLIYDIARKFWCKEAALFPVLFYLGFSYVMDHGLSFRTDPLCAFLFLGSLNLLVGTDRTRVHMILSAALMAAAVMISIKSVFYLATIGPILLTQTLIAPVKRGAELKGLIYIIGFILMLFSLYHFHSISIPSASVTEAGIAMMGAGNKTLLTSPLFPRAHYIVRGFLENPLVWLFVLFGLLKTVHDAARGHRRQEALILLSFSLPLLSLLFYRNAFPYFFVFLMPAVVILGGVSVNLLITHSRQAGASIMIGVLGGTMFLMSASFVTDYIRKLPDQTLAQSEVVKIVHRMYPEPVPYIDRNSMIASFPKAGFFMSSWGMENYRARNKAVMKDLIRRKQPRFLIANNCALEIAPAKGGHRKTCRHRLIDEDFRTLQRNFIHHWGSIFVAGKAFDLTAPHTHQTLEILIAGTYTLEAGAPISIDGVIYQPGDRVRLGQAVHRIAATGTATRATLRLGPALYKPGHAPSSQQIYFKF